MVRSVAVAVMFGWPAGGAATRALKAAGPPGALSVIAPSGVWPSPWPEGSHAALANSSMRT